MVMNEMICKGNKTACLSSSDFQEFIINGGGDMESKNVTTLSAVPKRIDKYGTQIACSEEV